ncbi:Sec1-like protein, partial [Leucosporidium creatinivorum]
YLETLRSCPSRWKVLIVDEHTQKMLNSVLSTYDILEEGVQQVDVITAQRSPQPRLAAIYLLMPTSQNVELVLRDHGSATPAASSSRLSKKKDSGPPPAQAEGPKYASAYLNFIDGISDGLVERLTAGLPDNYLQALKELYTNFHALEARVFSLKMPRSFFTLYAPPEHSPQDSLQRWEDEIGWMSRALVNALATLGEYPLIRYYNPPSSFHAPLGPALAAGEHVGKRLAERVQREIDAYARDNSDFPPIPDPPRPRGVLFITDRSMDLYAPLLHEFTYQAMCNDLLDIENGTKYRYTFQNESGKIEDKEANLTDEDKVWTEVRHMHMKDALDKLIADFKAYAGEHGGKFGGEGLNDMKDMLASLPQLREAKEKLSLHLTMAEKCMGIFEKKKLPLSASVEQCCATGVTPEGKTPKTLVEEMVPLLDDRSVSSTDKLRIIAMYIMHRDGVPEGDKKRLYQHARLALHEMDAVDNLAYLGVNVSKDSGKKRKPLFKQRPEEDAYDISRFQPSLKYMLEDHFSGTLDQSVFPYVRDAPVASGGSSSLRNSAVSSAAGGAGSLRSARPQWTSQRGRRVVNEPRQRVMVFVAGGMTYSEIRAAYKVSESANKDIFIGSTNIVTPEEFVLNLSNLDRGAGAGLASHGSNSTTFQAPKKGSRPLAAPSDVSQDSMDRRFAAAPPQQRPPPSQYPQQPLRNSYHAPPPAQGNYAPPPQQQQQASRPPQGYVPSLSHSPTPSQMSSSTAGGADKPEKEKKKKKKLFGF